MISPRQVSDPLRLPALTRASTTTSVGVAVRRDVLRLALLLVAVLAVGLLADAAVAQVLPETPPPEARIQRARPVWVGYIVMFLLTAVIITVSLMPSKRAHQD